MKTASLRSYHGPGRISIARWVRGAPAGYKVYSRLAPAEWFNKVSPEEYCARYAKILEGLDPRRTYFELGDLVAPHEPILLCWETPPFSVAAGNWCHRRLCSAWLEKTLHIRVPELGHENTTGLFKADDAPAEFPEVFQDWLDTL